MNDELYVAIEKRLQQQTIKSYFPKVDVVTFAVPRGTSTAYIDTLSEWRIKFLFFLRY